MLGILCLGLFEMEGILKQATKIIRVGEMLIRWRAVAECPSVKEEHSMIFQGFCCLTHPMKAGGDTQWKEKEIFLIQQITNL